MAAKMSMRRIQAAMDENVRLGDMEEVGVGENGEMRYRLTEQGKRKVEAMIAGNGVKAKRRRSPKRSKA